MTRYPPEPADRTEIRQLMIAGATPPSGVPTVATVADLGPAGAPRRTALQTPAPVADKCLVSTTV